MVEVVNLIQRDSVEIVMALEKLLAQAQVGEITSLAYAITRPNGDLATDFCWEGGRSAPLLLAATTMLERHVTDALLEANDLV